jgi:hypothetical protein
MKHHARGWRVLTVPFAVLGIALRAFSSVMKLYYKYWKFGVPNRPKKTP